MDRQEEMAELNRITEAVKCFWKEEGRLTRDGLRIRQELLDLTGSYVYYCIHEIIKTPDIITRIMKQTYHSVFDNLMNLKSPKTLKLWAGRLALQHTFLYVASHEENYPLAEEMLRLEEQIQNEDEMFHEKVKQAEVLICDQKMLIPVELIREDAFLEQLSDNLKRCSILTRFLVVGFYLNGLNIGQLSAQFSMQKEQIVVKLFEFETGLKDRLFPKMEHGEITVARALRIVSGKEQERLKIPSAILEELRQYFKEEYFAVKNRIPDDEDEVLRSYLVEEESDTTLTEDIMDLKEKLRLELEQVQKKAQEENARKKAEVERSIEVTKDQREKRSEERERIMEQRREEDLRLKERLEPDSSSRYRIIFIVAAALCCVIVIIILAVMYDNMSEKLSVQKENEQRVVIEPSVSKDEIQKKEEVKEVAAEIQVEEEEAYAMLAFVENLRIQDGQKKEALKEEPEKKGRRQESLRNALQFYHALLDGRFTDIRERIYGRDVNSFVSYYRGHEDVYGILDGYQITQAFLLKDFNHFYRSIYGRQAETVTEGEIKTLNDGNTRFQYVKADRMVLYCSGAGKQESSKDGMFYIEELKKDGNNYHIRLKDVGFSYGITSKNVLREDESFRYSDFDTFVKKQKLAGEYLSGKRDSVFFYEGEEYEFAVRKTGTGYQIVTE